MCPDVSVQPHVSLRGEVMGATGGMAMVQGTPGKR
jgi:hypothetical protein